MYFLHMSLVTILASLCFISSSESTDICVYYGENACTNCSTAIPSLDIQTVLESSSTSKLNILLCSRQILLEDLIHFQHKSSVVIQSYNHSELTRIICNTSRGGFKFSHVSTITLKNFQIQGCGDEYESTSVNTTTGSSFFHFKSSVYVLNSSSISIVHVNVTESDGTGLTILDSGIVLIENSTFEQNAVKNKGNLPGGGGVYIEFSYCTPGEVCNDNHVNSLTRDSNYTIRNCTFKNNEATTVEKESTSYFRSSGTRFQSLGRGGGLSIHFRGYAENNTINVLNCTFVDNSAIWGGGLYILVRDSSAANTIHVNHSMFINNRATLNGGGGLEVGFQFFDQFEQNKNKINFYRCDFFNNSAEFGGGTFIFSGSSSNFVSLENEISFDRCRWEKNRARFGAAMNVATSLWEEYKIGYLPSPKFRDCWFKFNFVDSNFDVTYHHKIEGKGTFIASGINVEFEGNATFISNSDTALYLDSSSAKFAKHSRVLFEENIGQAGGGILLLGVSWMEIDDDSTFLFSNNIAREKGGGICQLSYSINDYLTSKSCFLVYAGTRNLTDRNIDFSFAGNRAGLQFEEEMPTSRGHSIFASSLHPCFTGCLDKELEHYSETFDCIANFTFVDSRKNDISSIGEILTFTQEIAEFEVIPGGSIELPVTLKDNLNNSVVALYYLFFLNDSSISVTDEYISSKWVQLFGSPGDRADIRVETVQGLVEVAFTIRVKLTECTPGYILENVTINERERKMCQCSALSEEKLYDGIVSCDDSVFKANLKIGYWIGDSGLQNSTEKEVITGYCPIGYCTYNTSNNILALPNSNDREELDKLICGSRTGRFCARCRGNLSTHHHISGFKCDTSDKCNLGWLLFIISEILPITLFFFIIVIFNINFTGILNGLIFFFQVTDVSIHLSSGFVKCPTTIEYLMEIYNSIIGIFNLKFFYHSELSFCLWQGAQTLDLLVFRYVKIVYSLLLVFMIVFILRACSSRRMTCCIPRLFDTKSTIIHGLSGFLVTCYSECTKISLLILIPVRVYGQKNTNAVLYNGELEYFHGKHLAYAIPALLFLILFGCGPVLLLVTYPFCYRIFSFLKISESKFVKCLCIIVPLEKFKPFYDSFQSSFKDEYRFCSGFYFVYRLTILMTFAIARNITNYYIVILIEFVMIFCLHSIIQPYKKRLHNILDSFVFANLLIINVLTFYSYRRARELAHDHTISVTCTLLTLLHYLPLGVLLVICAVEVTAKLRNVKIRRKDAANSVIDGNELSESLLLDRRESISDSSF